MIDVGMAAPGFALEADDGTTVTLEGLHGSKFVLYFYPKDDTSGCTVEACEFRDTLPRFATGAVQVFGVSPDSVASHVRFRDKYDLTFPLLADTEREAAEAYGVWKEKSMYGRKYMGIERTTFLIDEEGVVEHVWRKVKAKGHAAAVADVIGA